MPISPTGRAFRLSRPSGRAAASCRRLTSSRAAVTQCRNRVATMTETLPLFPLGMVLYPGLVLPLHVFEDRYKQLVRDLLSEPEPRRFGVIAIREGRETGIGGVSALHEVGCTATIREVVEADNGEYDLV